MKNILFLVAAFCCLSSLTWAADRNLDSTLLVTKDGLTVIGNAKPVQFKCGKEWSIAFTNNGRTATLRTKFGHWTLTGLRPDIVQAAISEAAPLIGPIALAIGVSPADVPGVTVKVLFVANNLAKKIGTSDFDKTLAEAVALANNLLDSQGIHPADFNDEILAAIKLLGPSGLVLDASNVTVSDVHKNARKVIGIILNALASSGSYSH